MKSIPRFVAILCSAALTASAATRTSANYSISAETTDGGGARSISASYTSTASIGGLGGISTAAAPAHTLKHGYAGQLFDVNSLSASATPAWVPEAATTQLGGFATLDDATIAGLSGADIRWTVLSGPIAGVSAGGLATANIVYTNQSAAIQGTYFGAASTVALVVIDTDPDNFGSYAGDGLPDWWQVQYFGLGNPNAAPNADPDHDGVNNLTEFIEGTDPTSSASAFYLRIATVPGQPARKNLIFGPRMAGRDYTLQFETNLSSRSFAALTGTTQLDNGSQRTVTDLSAVGRTKFYRVNIGLSLPILLSPGRQGAGFRFHLPTLAGFNYLVEYKNSLSDPAWTPLQWVLGDGQTQTVTDPGATLASRFYRVQR